MSKRLKVFEIIGDSSLTGAPRHLLALVKGLDKKRFDLSVIAPQGALLEELKKVADVTLFAVPMRGRSDRLAISAMGKLIAKYRPQLVHAHGSRAGLLGRVAARGSRAKIIYTEHTRVSEFKLPNPVLEWSHLRAMKILDRWTHLTIAVSKAVREFLLRRGITQPKKVVVVYNGIAPREPYKLKGKAKELAAKLNLRENPLVIGTVGSLNYLKDTVTLIRAFQKVTRKKGRRVLLIVGDGPLRRYLEKLVAKLKLQEKVIFTGFIKEIEAFMPLLSIFVLPSLSEAFGLSILEAMRADVPVIATRVGGIPEVVQNGRSGLLVPPRDPKALAAAIMRLSQDAKLQRRLLSGARETLKRFSARRMVEETEKIYEKLAPRL